MLEAARILGCLSAVLLIVAVVSWVKLVRGPLLQQLNGRAARRLGSVETASQLLVVAAGLSAVAALLAVAGWFAT